MMREKAGEKDRLVRVLERSTGNHEEMQRHKSGSCLHLRKLPGFLVLSAAEGMTVDSGGPRRDRMRPLNLGHC